MGRRHLKPWPERAHWARGRLWPLGGFLLLALLVAAGCTGGAKSSVPGGNKSGAKIFRIAVIPKGTSHEFWKSVEAGARRADREFDDVVVSWKGPLSEGQTDDQIQTVEGFMADQYDGICLAPLDAVALRKTVDRVLAAKIPVVIFDSALERNDDIVSYVATNNYRAGTKGGEYLAKLLDGKGKIILLRYDLNSESTEQREQGFLDALKKFPGIEPLSIDQYAGPGEDNAVEKAENLLLNYGDQVDGIFCPNESTASGMLTALRRVKPGRVGKIKFVGFDAGDNIIDGLKKGHLHGTMLQDPVMIGYEAVRVMREYLHGRSVPARIETREHLAAYDDLNNPTTRELLFPEAVK